MKKIIGILFGLSLLAIPFQAYAQSLGEIGEQLDEANLEKAKQIASGQQPQSSFQDIDCLPWQTKKAVSGGGIICVDSSQGASFDENTGYIIGGIIVAIIIIAIIVSVSKKSEQVSYKDLPRQKFPSDVEVQTLKNQDNKCNECEKPIGVVKGRTVYFDYDHIDGDHSNNSPENCQVLCKNCHAEKNERERGMHDDSN